MSGRETEHELIDWVLRYATAHDDLGGVLDGFCRKLRAAGCQVSWAAISMPVMHPGSRAMRHLWTADAGSREELVPHGLEGALAFQRGPIFYLQSNNETARRWRLEAGEGVEEFAMLAELRAAGLSDYLLCLVPFADPTSVLRGAGMSIATDRAGGFTAAEIMSIERLTPALGLAAYRIAAVRTATVGLVAYLGPATAKRVMAGQIQRGEGETIAAAILLADLKQFTAMSDCHDPLAVVGWLNEHLEAVGGAVAAHGGEILKFMGDGLLAVFPVVVPTDASAQPCRACEQAVAAAQSALVANQALNARRAVLDQPQLEVDLALHFGEVVYGNVGTRERLDFTVIGRAVNETSRMEALCDQLGQSIVLSDALAQRYGQPTVPLGRFALRGIAGLRLVHTLAPA